MMTNTRRFVLGKRSATLSMAALFACTLMNTELASAQAPRKSANGRDIAVALPLALNGESVAKLEMNLGGNASLALELQSKPRGEEISEEKVAETKESVMNGGQGLALLVSRYADASRMAGFYWSLGLGYRQQKADWRTRPDQGDKDIDLSLADADQTLHHRATLSGATAHGRVGYRYAGEELPLMIGAYIGLRHFQSGVKDDLPSASDTENAEGPTYSAMTNFEKERLKRRYMTRLEPAIELGFIF